MEVPVWTPDAERVERANLTRFQRFLRETRGLDHATYDDLWRWSVEDLAGFWGAVWEFFDLGGPADRGYDDVLIDDAMPGATWFPGARLNVATYLLARGEPDATAIVTTDESGAVQAMSRAGLREQTAALAATLRRLGVGRGDVVAGYVPNVAEAVVAFLATATIGGTWSSVGQDYAASAVVDRLGQLRPRVLVTADGYHFGGRRHSRLAALAEIRAALPTVEHVVMVDRLGTGDDGDWIRWSDATAAAAAPHPDRDAAVDPPPGPVAVPFDHPLWVLFSSGTTGLPKGLVHGHGGVLLETLKQMSLHWDLRPDDRVFWYTSPSWVMWNLQLSTLAVGGSIVCHDGSPTHPDADQLWRLAADHGVTFLGVSPGYLQASVNAGVRPARDHDLGRLRSMGSTGSPLAPHLHRWAHEEVGDLPLWSMSGGTDVAGAFVGGAPTVPIWPGELSVRCLGVAMEAWDEAGRPVTGEVGEMVIRRPMPSMPVRLWDDPDGERYRAAYFDTFPDAWRQGDWVTVTERGSVVIHGRSDSTLNRHGVRMGSADIYAAVETVPEVVEALVIGAEQPDGSYWMPLFVVLADGHTLDDPLVDRLRTAIRRHASPRHVPDEVIAVPGIPHTRTGKKLEVPVKRILQGAPLEKVAQVEAVDDPALLAPFLELARSRAR